MNRTPRVLYDVYEDGKLRYRLISLSKAAEVTGTARSIITRSAENGHKIHKKIYRKGGMEERLREGLHGE